MPPLLNPSAAEVMDYPCSNMKEFEAIVGVTRSLLRQLLGEAVELRTQRIDEGGIDGDLCAVVSAGTCLSRVTCSDGERVKSYFHKACVNSSACQLAV